MFTRICYLLLLGLGVATVLHAQPRPQFFDSLLTVRTDTLYFDFGKDELRPSADAVLRALYTDWRTGARVYLTGHTDAVGTDAANDDLARRRASRARTFLLNLGLPDSALLVRTFGERAPVAANITDSSRQRNRRVTLDLLLPRPHRRVPLHIVGADSVGLAAKIIFSGKTLRDSVTTDTSGRATIDLPLGEVLRMEVYAPGYFFFNHMFKVVAQAPLPTTLQLQPATPGQVADISDLFFVGNKAELLPQSEPALTQVLRFMQVNPTLKIIIAGHVNYPNSPVRPPGTFEHDLSEWRAAVVYDYLIANEIAAERMSHRGFSNSQMRFPYARTLKEQAANRRVEIWVVE